jgi:hypothetical protein
MARKEDRYGPKVEEEVGNRRVEEVEVEEVGNRRVSQAEVEEAEENRHGSEAEEAFDKDRRVGDRVGLQGHDFPERSPDPGSEAGLEAGLEGDCFQGYGYPLNEGDPPAMVRELALVVGGRHPEQGPRRAWIHGEVPPERVRWLEKMRLLPCYSHP